MFTDGPNGVLAKDRLRQPDPAAVGSPPLLMAFDLLYRDGRDLTGRPLASAGRGSRISSPAARSSYTSRLTEALTKLTP